MTNQEPEGISIPDIEYISETHRNLMILRAKYYSMIKPTEDQKYQGIPLTCPIVLEAQLMQLASDKRELRSEIEALSRQGIARQFILDQNLFPGERYYMIIVDYEYQLKELHNEVVDRFLDLVKGKYNPIIKQETLTAAKFSKKDIQELVNQKVLLVFKAPVASYMLCIPFIAPFRTSVAEGRREIVRYIKTKPGCIIDENEILTHNIKDSIFIAEFHYKELLGIGSLEEVIIKGRPKQVHLIRDPFNGK